MGSIKNLTIDEESELSASQIGSLVSYTINYLEKKPYGDSIVDQIHEVKSEDSDDSMLVEKEDSADAISHKSSEDENLDLSASDGSDHEDEGD